MSLLNMTDKEIFNVSVNFYGSSSNKSLFTQRKVAQQSPVNLDLGLRKTRAGKSHSYRNRMSVVSHASRLAYKSIRKYRGRFDDTTLVDLHTSKSLRLQFESPTLKSIRIHNLSRFAYKKVIRLRI